MTEITLKEFVRRIKDEEVIENSVIIGSITHSTISDLLEYDNLNQEYHLRYRIIVEHCSIDHIDLRSVNFHNKFEIKYSLINHAIFTGAKFHKGANFSTTEFIQTVSFMQSWFFWTAYFSETKYRCTAEFSFANFLEWSMFHSAEFYREAKFGSAFFRKRALFPYQTHGDIDYSSCHFESLFILNTKPGMGRSSCINFSNCEFNGHVNLNGLVCDRLDLSSTVNRGILDVNLAVFHTINLVDANYSELNLEVEQLTGCGNDHDKPGNKLFAIDYGNNLKDLKIILMRLKSNYQRLCRRDEEDLIYRELRRAETDAYLKNKEYLNYLIGKLILDPLFGYGTIPLRAFCSSILFILFYSLVYLLLGISNEYPNIFSQKFQAEEIGNYLYFSTVTFTTIGYGDITPVGISKVISASEGFIGVFMMAAFAVTFSRKLLR